MRQQETSLEADFEIETETLLALLETTDNREEQSQACISLLKAKQSSHPDVEDVINMIEGAQASYQLNM